MEFGSGLENEEKKKSESNEMIMNGKNEYKKKNDEKRKEKGYKGRNRMEEIKRIVSKEEEMVREEE